MKQSIATPVHPTPMRLLLWVVLSGIFICLGLASCHYPSRDLTDEEMSQSTRDSLTHLYERHYTLNLNLIVETDSINLACLPLKDCTNMVYQGDHVVVAEFAIDPTDSVDSVWVKLAHSQKVQGWVHEKDLKANFVPVDIISQGIYFFSHTHAATFIIIFAVFLSVWLYRTFKQKRYPLVYFNDIDSLYPLFLCLLVSATATLYESMQLFTPDTWEMFYYNPTLSPLKVPFIISLFLVGFWMILIVLIAAVSETFKLLYPSAAVFYLLGLGASCVFCYFFFIYTTRIYVGYLFLAFLLAAFIYRAVQRLHTPDYVCGKCGQKLSSKGICPHCGALNE